MIKESITEEEQLRYENDRLKRQLWCEHKKLFDMLRVAEKESIKSACVDSSYMRYTILNGIVLSLDLLDEYKEYVERI